MIFHYKVFSPRKFNFKKVQCLQYSVSGIRVKSVTLTIMTF